MNCEEIAIMLYLFKVLGNGGRTMTPEGFLFLFLTLIVGLCITVVIVVASTISSTVAAIADDEDTLAEE